jgi:valyl-tRNA synthetase
MDTWATSSLTPELAAGWEDDPDLFDRVFPMDLRPQAFEIIRTWLFSTVVRAHFEFDALPWRDAAISGWVLDPDRKKMSKSKGNVVTPMEPIRQFGADAMRYWAASGRPGVDTAVDEGQMKVGRRLAIKVLNASKFALGVIGDEEPAGSEPAGFEPASEAVTELLDRSMLASLSALVADATSSFEIYDYARALDATERFFWGFCDDYLELVKGRAYAGSGSARAALAIALDTVLRLFAPHMPFVTEEVWSWWRDGSIHRASWPTSDDLAPFAADDLTIYPAAAAVLGELRKAKSEAKRSMRTEVTAAVVRAPSELLRALEPAAGDVRDAGRVVGELELAEASELAVDVTLAAPEEPPGA